MAEKYRDHVKTVDIDRALHRQLKEAAARHERSVKSYAEKALREHLDRERKAGQ
jgi:predicted HicB family RNase H-like nuclease